MENNKKEYYNLTKEINPHSNIAKFLELDLPPQNAIDLGCGAGRDTVALLKNGWNVLAIDKEDTELIIVKQLTSNEIERFSFLNDVLGNVILPKTNLIVANFSLPFIKKNYFYSFFNKINDSILKGGYFVGNFFGKKDSWTDLKTDLVFLNETEVKSLFSNFELIQFNEIEKDAKLASGEEKHWHVYDVIAKKLL